MEVVCTRVVQNQPNEPAKIIVKATRVTKDGDNSVFCF